MLIPALGQTDTGDCSYRDTTEPEVSGTVFRQRNRTAHNTFRYYDLDTGRFTMPDPIGLAGGLNLYRYAPNLLMWIDPWGLVSCSAKFPSRRVAFRAAKRDAGIPMTQRPDKIYNRKTGFYGDHRNVRMTDSKE